MICRPRALLLNLGESSRKISNGWVCYSHRQEYKLLIRDWATQTGLNGEDL
jgi:hypothetical protein